MTTQHKKRISKGYEPIPGYVLEEQVGRGGFGEVWRAAAPGGLKKAVKFVFGSQDQSRASRELRSLERIKGVQHPFLLTLERFEIVGDQLVIVTELADGSLEDVFNRSREHGSCGIPRDTLLSHLHDTADALDYLHGSYQLQHLDIKPGNLLLVGGHVKVADFGLLKDLREVECSVVGGLTPVYAPPEVFDGRPSMHSDQYSLAIMYQELLTGTRPFSGRTIAQLATQHVHSAPNLEPLPPSDRPMVARALEKNPDRRFPTCKAFVEALRNPRNRSTSVTSCGSGDLSSEDTKRGHELLSGAASTVQDLPQLSNSSRDPARGSATHTALVVALGGTGAACLRELRRRSAKVHAANHLDLHAVLIDTDMETIHSMRVAEASERVSRCLTIFTPLRTAHEYRQNGTDRLKTISRRWIYNVPRSGATEGMRPLGRLALVDHGPMVANNLRQAVEELATAVGDSTPSVYVVGSLTGGTASGMYIDVVHLLRHLLDEAGLEEARILSMLSSATVEIDSANPLAMHDTQAALLEIEHFMQAGNGYPGDDGAGWPSVPAARTPLRDIYLVSGPAKGSLVPSAAETMTEYVWSDATGAGELLSAARTLENVEHSTILPPSLRSVGIIPLGNSHHLEQKVLVPALVHQLLLRWLGLPAKARHAASLLADRMSRRAGFASEPILQGIAAQLAASPHRDQLERIFAELGPQPISDPSRSSEALDQWHQQLACSGAYDWVSSNVMNNFNRELSVHLNDRRIDVTTVIESVRLISQNVNTLAVQLREHGDPSGQTETSAQFLDVAARQIAAGQFERIRHELNLIEARFEQFATSLAMAVVELTSGQAQPENPWREMPERINAQFPSLLVRLHEATVNRHLVRPLNDPSASDDPKMMVHEMAELALPLVLEVVPGNGDALLQGGRPTSQSLHDPAVISPASQSASLTRSTITDAMFRPGQFKRSGEPLSVDQAIVAVRPPLLAFGGLQRVLLVVGSETEQSQLEPQLRAVHEGALTVAVIPGCQPKLIHEAQQIETKNILSRLSILNGGNSQITGRLASRTDVAW